MSSVPIDINTVLLCLFFIGSALIGGAGYVFFYSVTDKKVALRHLVLSMIAGYIYYILYSQHSFPNTIMAIVVGWFAPDFIEGIMKKYKEKKGGNGGGDE